MPSKSSNIEIKPLADFKNLVENGQFYTGLVESIGYVYWETETLWFEHINSNDTWATPQYQQIQFPSFPSSRRNPVFSKISYTLHVLSPEELKRCNWEMYHAYYGYIFEMPSMRVDALRVDRVIPRQIMLPNRGNRVATGSNGLFRVGATVDEAIGAPLGLAEIVTGNRNVGIASKALTGLSIINELDNGEYYSAGGKTLLFTITQISSKANIVAGVISFGMWLNDTDYMQRQLARGYAQEYKRNEYLYDLESKRRNPNRAAMDRYSDAMSLNLRLFKQCVDGLGYQY